jgi:hypothetical protein
MNGRRLALRALLIAVTIGCVLGVIAVFGGLSKTMERALLTSLAVSGASILAMAGFSAWDLRSAILFSRLGVACSLLGGVLVIASIWTESGSDTAARAVGTVCVLAVAGAVGSVVELARLAPAQRWLRLAIHGVGTVLTAGVLAVLWEIVKDSSETLQVLGALTIIYASGSLAIMILHFLNGAATPEGGVAEVCFCPRCGKRLWVPAGEVRCKHCASAFFIELRPGAEIPAAVAKT